jgi:hypothetical protein
MQKVNMDWFMSFAVAIEPLATIKHGVKLKDCYYPLYTAQMWLEFFLGENNSVPCPIASPSGNTLLGSIKSVTEAVVDPSTGTRGPGPDMEKQLDFLPSYNIPTMFQTFKTVLTAEVQSLNTYGSAQEFGETRILGCFPKNDEFGLCDRHALSLQ